MVADEAEPALGIESIAVEGDDARRLLAAVLEGVQSERGDGGGIGMTEDAEDSAFFTQAVGVGVVVLERIGDRRFETRHGGHHHLVAPERPYGLTRL